VNFFAEHSVFSQPNHSPVAGFATTLPEQPKRAAAIPSPGGLPLLGKQRKEFAAAKALEDERAGASESLGQGEGELPSHHLTLCCCHSRFTASLNLQNCTHLKAMHLEAMIARGHTRVNPTDRLRAPLLGGVRGWVRRHRRRSNHHRSTRGIRFTEAPFKIWSFSGGWSLEFGASASPS